MKKGFIILLTVFVFGSLFVACAENKEHSELKAEKALTESKESHARDYSDGQGEEDGTAIAKNEKFTQNKNGVNLILTYNEEKSTFMGSIENITERSLSKVRVEIHLSNGKELGPTTPAALAPGEVRKVSLNAKGENFESWNTHVETGSTKGRENGEHGSSESKEYSGEGEGEHR